MAALCLPAAEVGGDYYDLLPLGDTRMGVLVADVSGKGTSAALYMAELKGLVLSLSRIYDSPARLLGEANRILAANMDSRSFVTMTYAVVDTAARSHALRARRAQPRDPLRGAPPGAPAILAPPGLGLGLDPGERFEQILEEVEVPLVARRLLPLLHRRPLRGDEPGGRAVRRGAPAPDPRSRAGALGSEELKERILEEVPRLRGRRRAPRRHDAGRAQGRGGGEPGVNGDREDELRTRWSSALGYRFADLALLDRALTHASLANEERRARRWRDNEPLEFLGDAVLGLRGDRPAAPPRPRRGRGPQEPAPGPAGVGAEPRAPRRGARPAGAAPARPRGGEDRRAREDAPCGPTPTRRSSAALYLDGGFEAAHRFVRAEFARVTSRTATQPLEDPKSALQERLQAEGRPLPRYRWSPRRGPATGRRFRVECRLDDGLGHRGRGLLEEGGAAGGRPPGPPAAPRERAEGSALDPAAAQADLAVVEDGGLAGRDRALRLVEAHLDATLRRAG